MFPSRIWNKRHDNLPHYMTLILNYLPGVPKLRFITKIVFLWSKSKRTTNNSSFIDTSSLRIREESKMSDNYWRFELIIWRNKKLYLENQPSHFHHRSDEKEKSVHIKEKNLIHAVRQLIKYFDCLGLKITRYRSEYIISNWLDRCL